MSVLVNFAIFPMDKAESGVSQYVSKVLKMIDESGVPYKLNPMGTTVETNTMQEALAILQKAHDVLDSYSERIYLSANFDIRKGRKCGIEQKISSIEQHIGQVQS